MTTLTVSQARAQLPTLLDRVEAGEEVTITRHGRVVAVVMRPDLVRHRRRASDVFAEAERTRELIERARTEPLRQAHGLTVERADELVAQIRADRDAE